MLHKFALVLLVDQARVMQTSCVLPYRLGVCLQSRNNAPQGYRVSSGNQKKDINPVVVSHPLQVSLHLLGCFTLRHPHIVHLMPTNSSL